MKTTLKYLIVLTLIISLISIVGCNKKTARANQLVRFAIDTAGDTGIQFRVARAKGLFEKHGIKAEFSDYAYGVDTLNAVITGTADTGIAADYAAINRLSGDNMKIVATISRSGQNENKDKNKSGNVLLGKGIDSPKELKGKKLGVSKGTVMEYLWVKYLNHHNIKDDEVKFVALQSPAETLAAIQSGDIDAAFFNGELIPKVKNIEGIKEIGSSSEVEFSVRGFFLAKNELANKDPKLVSNILKALNEATEFIKKNPDEAADIVYKELKVPKETVLEQIKVTNRVVEFNDEDYEHLNEIKEWGDNKGIFKKYELRNTIDTKPLKEAFSDKVSFQNDK
ncbi:ABC-type nitrate/sulfonate/bicarbonate transport system, periplasmic component [Gottschalkia purinilytica]|uniref:ABC-type nitrate/sulfonate/bicarbonate transport system, periplasmic component n=1 Tax=Gottschalkia purinilytica TaxID=1503 RepID=A0A0L0WDJ9_GOTPU|nr:ABC transporter substrate-binding protein [Gottschalkia purinilytica]KNF09552.1 ABC-type nitrate/sulfonate/bicarbonate transport system, periplasmic component [Gottschalkia purinilytica]